MGKIGIVTLNGYKNYGNRLQNYALERTIENLGFDVNTIVLDINSSRTSSSAVLRRIRAILSMHPRKLTYKFNKMKEKRNMKEYDNLKTEKFKEFSKKYLNEVKKEQSDLKNYDYFVTGSDQVWNPYYINGSDEYFLRFAPSHKRVSYAASFGINHIPSEFEDKFKLWLSEMNAISVREEQGEKIVSKLSNRNSEVVLDPTMLLEKDEWEKLLESNSLDVKQDAYVLTYFLGDLPNRAIDIIQQLKRKNNKIEVINLASSRDLKHYCADPIEFLKYIKNSKLFLTDSFHGLVFSIIFERDFIAFDREGSNHSMTSRIETLLSKFNLENRHEKTITDTNENIDFHVAREKLLEEREKSMMYIKNALGK